MNKEIIGIEKENFDRIPLKERMEFQIILIKLMLGEKSIEKTHEEWNQEEIKWIELYAKRVSDIIDNPQNEIIRTLIMKQEYLQAADIVIKILEKEEIKMAA